ncbi:MAG: hypothetical protein FJ254_10210 [Phycisphaerae bacterium]|nr:hypothetical protein [Phycisphaerae bacterium]
MLRSHLVALFASATLAMPLFAQELHEDIWVTSSNGALTTGGWDHSTGEITSPFLRVFKADMGADPSFPFSIVEPGIGSDLIGSSLTFRMLQGLGAWNGNGFSTANEGLLVGYGGSSFDSITGGSFGFTVTPGIDLHAEFTLFGANDTDPANGIYLSSFVFESEGLQSSEVFYIVWNLGMSEADHDAAIDWVSSSVPAPGALALGGLLGLGGRRSRRR